MDKIGSTKKESSFFAMMSRMKYIARWALMRNAEPENISEHSLQVAMLAHALAVIGAVRLGKKINPEKAALLGLYHDSTEIITGDMPTPIKYYNHGISTAFKEIEKKAAVDLLDLLPVDMRPYYEPVLLGEGRSEEEQYLWKLEKAADKLSALIKCMEEEKAGNREFVKAKESIWNALQEMKLQEVEIFTEEFLSAFGKTLDEL